MEAKSYSENNVEKMEWQITENFKKGINLGLFGQGDINFFGSQKIKKMPIMADSILKSNTVLYSKSPMAYLAYGDMLELNGKRDLALVNFEKSITLAEEQKAPYLEGLKIRYEKAKNNK